MGALSGKARKLPEVVIDVHTFSDATEAWGVRSAVLANGADPIHGQKSRSQVTALGCGGFPVFF